MPDLGSDVPHQVSADVSAEDDEDRHTRESNPQRTFESMARVDEDQDRPDDAGVDVPCQQCAHRDDRRDDTFQWRHPLDYRIEQGYEHQRSTRDPDRVPQQAAGKFR